MVEITTEQAAVPSYDAEQIQRLADAEQTRCAVARYTQQNGGNV